MTSDAPHRAPPDPPLGGGATRATRLDFWKLALTSDDGDLVGLTAVRPTLGDHASAGRPATALVADEDAALIERAHGGDPWARVALWICAVGVVAAHLPGAPRPLVTLSVTDGDGSRRWVVVRHRAERGRTLAEALHSAGRATMVSRRHAIADEDYRSLAEGLERRSLVSSLGLRFDSDPAARSDAAVTLVVGDRSDRLTVEVAGGDLAPDTAALPQLVATIARQLVTAPDLLVDDAALVDRDEFARLVELGTRSEADLEHETLQGLIEDSARRFGARPAVSDDRTTLDYEELLAASRLLACRLEPASADPSPIGIRVSPSAELVVAICAVALTGRPYLPIDPSTPPERARVMMVQGGSRTLLCDRPEEGSAIVPADATIIDVGMDGPPSPGGHPAGPQALATGDDAAIVFFTSGSTGTPRGVEILNRAFVHKVISQTELLQIEDDHVMPLLGNGGADAIHFQLFLTLALGGQAVLLAPDTARSPRAFWQRARDRGFTLINCVPSLMDALLEGEPDLSDLRLRRVLLGGDRIGEGLVTTMRRRFPTDLVLVNLYGPTEVTVDATVNVDALTDLGAGPVPIGGPSPGSRLMVVGGLGAALPHGLTGELLVGGVGVVDGYLHEDVDGRARFSGFDFGTGEVATVFRTGDLASWGADGRLQFHGRVDDQVKVSGIRIEPAEVERAIMSTGLTDHVAVVGHDDDRGWTALTAWYVADDDIDPSAFVDEITGRLPPAAIPTAWIRVPSLPLTAIGKVDRRRLATRIDAPGGDSPGEASDDLDGVDLAWDEILGRPPRSAHENFFAAGGDSLRAMRLLSLIDRRLDVDVPMSAFLRTPTAEALRSATAPSRVGATFVERGEAMQVSAAQARFWLASELHDGQRSPLNMVEVFEPPRRYEPVIFRRAVARLLDRHEVLRASFRIDDGRLTQAAVAGGMEQGDVVVIVDGDEDDPAGLIERVFDTECRHAFEVGRAPLCRFTLVRSADWDRPRLVLNVHHLVGDAWSVRVMLNELDVLYRLERGEAVKPLPEVGVDYFDHVAWGLDHLRTDEGRDQLGRWARRMGDVEPMPVQMYDRPPPARRSNDGDMIQIEVPRAIAAAVDDLARGCSTTPFTVFTAAVRVLIERASSCDDIVLGVPVTGRDDRRSMSTVGAFVNTLPLRLPAERGSSFRDVVRCEDETLLAARASEAPFDLIVGASEAVRTPGRNPLFDVLVEDLVDGIELFDGDAAAHTFRPLNLVAPVSDFDLAFSMRRATALEIWVRFRVDVFDRETVDALARRLTHLLDVVSVQPDAPLDDLDLLTDDEREWLLVDCNDTAMALPTAASLLDLVEAQRALRPDDLAVVDDGIRLTYNELCALADELAERLRREGRVRPGDAVALVLEKTAWTVVGALAALKCAAAFVPLDPHQPEDRLIHCVRDCGATAILADPGSCQRLGERSGVYTSPCRAGAATGRPAASASGRPDVTPGPDDVAYVIYTSGSTGLPKGVVVEHRAIVNTVTYRALYYGFDGSASVLQVPPIHFDSGVNDIFSSLVAGARVVVPSSRAVLDAEALGRAASTEAVTHMMLVPSLYSTLLHQDVSALSSIQQVVLVGEAVSPALVKRHRRLMPETRLYNEYGPTEDAVWTTVHEITGDDDRALIGHPIANKAVDLLDDRGRLVPPGAVGEICISGAGLAVGYLNRPGQTATVFGPNPVRHGIRMYRTGDLACRTRDGLLQFLGRRDDQVKVRGQRVEPGEVTAQLIEHPDVERCAVVAAAGPDGMTTLVAYVVGRAAPSAVIEWAASRLPPSMVPAAVVPVDDLPRLSTGKLDRTSLPVVEWVDNVTEDPDDRDPIEELVRSAWVAVTGRAIESVDDDFFRAGGTSLSAVQVTTEIGRALGRAVSVSDLFECPTVRLLAARVRAAGQHGGVPIVLADNGPDIPLSPAQLSIWVAAGMTSNRTAFNVCDAFALDRNRSIDGLRAATHDLMRRHELLRAGVVLDAGRPVLRVLDDVEPPIAEVEGSVEDVLVKLRSHRFDLNDAPLFLLRVVRGEQEDHLVACAHHLIFDGTSTNLLIDELVGEHGAPQVGSREPSARFRDHVATLDRWLESDDARAQLDYWQHRLAARPPRLDFGDGGPRPLDRRPTGKLLRAGIPAVTWSRASEVSGRCNATPFMVVAAAYAMALGTELGRTELLIGMPADTRRPGFERVIGCFVNQLVLRVELAFDTFDELLTHVRCRALEAYERRHVPFETIADLVEPSRDHGRRAVVDVGLSWEGSVDSEQRIEAPTEEVPIVNDVWVFVSEWADELRLEASLDTSVTAPERADRILRHLVALLTVILDDPDRTLDELAAAAC